MKTLIQIQDKALAKLSVSRSSARRYLKLKGAVRRWYIKEIAKLGITNVPPTYTAKATWQDVLDMLQLQADALDEEVKG